MSAYDREVCLDAATGELSLGDALTIGPALTLEQVAAVAEVDQRHERSPGHVELVLSEAGADVRFRISLHYADGRLQLVGLSLVGAQFGSSWSEWSRQKEKARVAAMRRWLRERWGVEEGHHTWGELRCAYDERTGAGSLSIHYAAGPSPGGDEAAPARPLTCDEARRLAEAGGDLVVLDEATLEREWGWAFVLVTRRYAETRDVMDMPIGIGPILVNRHDGSVHRFDSSRPVDAWAEHYERQLLREKRRREGAGWLRRLFGRRR